MNPYENWIKRIIIFIVAQTITLFGSSMVGFAVIWYIALKTSSGMFLMISTICTFLPQILIALFAGVFADRYNRKWLIIGSDIFTATVTLALALLIVAGYESWWLIFLVSALRSLGAGVQAPSVNAILPQLVPESHLMRITGINTTLNSLSMIASPAVGGILLSLWGLHGALIFDVVTAIIGSIVFAFLKVPSYSKITPQGNSTSSVFIELKEGLAYAKSSMFIRSLLLFYSLFFILLTPIAFLSPLLIERTFGNHVWMLTANEIAWSLGCVIGGLIIAIWCGFKSKVFSMAVSCLGFGICYILMGFASNFVIYLLIVLLSGLFMPLFSSSETVLIQELVEEGMLGRVFSLINIIVSATLPIGMVIFGPLSDVISVQAILIGCGIITVFLSISLITNKKLLALG